MSAIHIRWEVDRFYVFDTCSMPYGPQRHIAEEMRTMLTAGTCAGDVFHRMAWMNEKGHWVGQVKPPEIILTCRPSILLEDIPVAFEGNKIEVRDTLLMHLHMVAVGGS